MGTHRAPLHADQVCQNSRCSPCCGRGLAPYARQQRPASMLGSIVLLLVTMPPRCSVGCLSNLPTLLTTTPASDSVCQKLVESSP